MKKLSVGLAAPPIHTRDVKHHDVSISKSNYTLVTFLRYSGCKLCNLALQRLTLEHKLLTKSGCDVVAFVQSTEDNIQKNIYDRHDTPPPFPVVADLKGEWYTTYGVASDKAALPKALMNLPAWFSAVQTSGFKTGDIDGSLFLVPALFIIDKHGVIQYANYDANFYTHEAFTPIYELLNFGSV